MFIFILHCIKHQQEYGQDDLLILSGTAKLLKRQKICELTKLFPPSSLGAAILQDLNKNHHKAKLGIKFIKPLLINSLRLPNRS